MAMYESLGLSDEWYTPKYIFDALECNFDLDVASPKNKVFIHVPANNFITENSLDLDYKGFIWMNPPFGGRNGLLPWINKFIYHGNGILLTPDRTSATWWQHIADKSEAVLFSNGKVKFIKPGGSLGKSPSTGTTLFSIGNNGMEALKNADKNNLGKLYINK